MDEKVATDQVVNYAEQINGFASVTVSASDTNLGLATSIRAGVSTALQKNTTPSSF